MKNEDKRKCTCKKWKKGIEHINGFILFCANQSAMYDFDLKYVFTHCPWCGSKLIKK